MGVDNLVCKTLIFKNSFHGFLAIDKDIVKLKCPRNVTSAKKFIENHGEMLQYSDISKKFTAGS